MDTDGLSIRPVADGCVVAVTVVAGAKRGRIVGVLGEALKIAVSQAPEKGRANAAVAELLAGALGLARRDVTLVSGPTSRRKEFHVSSLSPQQLRDRLEQVE